MSNAALEHNMRDMLDASTKTAVRFSKIIQDYLSKRDNSTVLVEILPIQQKGRPSRDILYQYATMLMTASNLRLEALDFLSAFEPQVGNHIHSDSITIAEGLLTVHSHFHKLAKTIAPEESDLAKLPPGLMESFIEVGEVAAAAQESAMRLTQYTIHRPRYVMGFGYSHEPLSL